MKEIEELKQRVYDAETAFKGVVWPTVGRATASDALLREIDECVGVLCDCYGTLYDVQATLFTEGHWLWQEGLNGDPWLRAAKEAESLEDRFEDLWNRMRVAYGRIIGMDDARAPWWKAAKRQIGDIKVDLSFLPLREALEPLW